MGHDHGQLWTREAAVEIVSDLRETALKRQPIERVELSALVDGRVIGDSIVATDANPAHSFSTMDGYAFDATESYPFDLKQTEVFPADEPPSLANNEAVRVATGAPIPREANAVLKEEQADVEGGVLRGAEINPGTYVYERGSNVAQGETLFEYGERVGPKDAVLLRDLGYERIPVAEPFKTGLLATGSEIHDGRSPDLDSPMLASLVRSWGHDARIEGTVPDEYALVEEAIESMASSHDVVITTGGTSVGKKDHVISALESLGEVCFHRVRVRPGKPIAAARLPDHDTVVFAVPGKPVGALLIATLVMRPFFTGSNDLPTIAKRVSVDVDVPSSEFEYAIPVEIDDDDDVAVPLGHASSKLAVYDDIFDPSVLSSSTRATRADGFVLTDTGFQAADTVDVIPFFTTEL